LHTITLSEKQGIKAVIGKPKGKKTTEIQNYLFSKEKGWTLEKAKTWFEKHKDESLPGHTLLLDLNFLTEKADPEARIFPWSMPAKYYAKPGRVVIYGTALLAGETRKGDKFSCQELVRAARGLIGGPIEVFEHTWDVGESRWLPFPDNIILDGEEVDGRLEYIAGVSEPKVQELIRDATIAKVSVNTICRHVPAEDPGQCDGMILNGFCLLHKDSVPASPGTSVQIWNCLKVNPDRLKSAGSPSLSDSEEGKNMTENEKQKTEQVPPVTGHGPVAGVPEPSIEDRVKTLETQFTRFQNDAVQQFAAMNAKLDTLLQTHSPPVISVPAVTAKTGSNEVTQATPETILNLQSFLEYELLKGRTLVFHGEVYENQCREAATRLEFFMHQNKEPVQIILNSVGGSVFDGLLVHDTIKRLVDDGVEVTCEVRGLAASMGTIILQAASHRLATPHTRFLIHEVSSFAWGKASNIQEEAEEITKVNDLLKGILAKRCGKTPDEIEKIWHKKDMWFSAEEALKFGLIDRVIDRPAKFTQDYKKITLEEHSRPKTAAEWDTEYINNLPDSAFAVIGAGGEKDDQGKTVPRALRKLPHHNAAGDLDTPHLQNALARLNQVEDASKVEAKSHLCAHAKDSEIVSEFCGEKPPEQNQEIAAPGKMAEKASPSPSGQGITKPVGDLPPAQPGAIPVTEIRKVFEDKRLFTPQLRERAILRLIGEEGDVHD
jgi:ATP-dependent Clp protease protease subunit